MSEKRCNQKDKAVSGISHQHGVKETEKEQKPQADVELGISRNGSHEGEDRLDHPDPAWCSDQRRHVPRIIRILYNGCPAFGICGLCDRIQTVNGTKSLQIDDGFRFPHPVFCPGELLLNHQVLSLGMDGTAVDCLCFQRYDRSLPQKH